MSRSAVAVETPAPVASAARRFKIAVFSYGLPCPGQKRGGIEQVAHDLSNALVDRGHAVTVFTYDPRPATARYETASLPARAFVMSWLGRRLTMGYLGNVLALGPGYRGFDVIMAHGDSLLLPLLGKPVIRVMHGTALEEARSATSIGRLVLQSGVYVQELLTALFQKGTVGISENTRRFNPFVRRVIPDGIDLSRFRPDPLMRSQHPSLLFVGALTGRKRGQWLLNLFEQHIRPAFPDTELHMVTAPGPAAQGVTYHSGISADALTRLYQRSWIYVSPSTYEGFGLPYVEALACGTPVVATSNPGSREILSGGAVVKTSGHANSGPNDGADAGVFGCLVSDEAFAPTVCRLLSDVGARAQMTSVGLARAKYFDIATTAAMYEGVIQDLVIRNVVIRDVKA